MTRRMLSTWIVWLWLIGIGAAVVTALVRLTEARLAFFPIPGEDTTPRDYGVAYRALTASTADGQRIQVWHLTRPDAKAHVLYFHGNGGNLSLWSDVLVAIFHQGFDVIGFDYRGYGNSTGSPSERGLYQDVEAVVQLWEREVGTAGGPAIYWGRSLGCTMAAYAARTKPPRGLILEAGFPSMRSVVETNPVFWLLSWFSSYRFPTAEWMSSVRTPVLMMHGDRDSVIPYRLGRRLYEGLAAPKRFITIEGGDHNDPVPTGDGPYWRAVDEFVASLPH